jgi:Protein of unknown function (DUF3093)
MEQDSTFDERLWYPTWPFVALFAFGCAVILVEGFVTNTDGTGWIWGFAVVTIGVFLWAVVLKLGYRRLHTTVDDRSVLVGRGIRVPRESVKEARIVSGSELKGLKAELREGANLVNTSRKPALRGLVMMPGAKTAVYLRIDPPVRETSTFVVATRRPQELLAALQRGGGPARDYDASPGRTSPHS